MITMAELLKYLQISRNTALKLIKEGMPHYMIGPHYRFDLAEVEEWIKGGKNNGENTVHK